MKKLIVLAALLFVGLGYSQTYRISTVGESKQFVIEDVTNGVRERPYLNREVLADTTSQGNINIYRQLAVDYLKPIGFPKVSGRAYTEFVDGNNSDATFASSAAVLTWFADNTGFNSASGGSGAGGDGSVKYKADDYTALSALSSPSTGDIAIVTDAGIGGTFIYDSTKSATDDGGTIIDGWVRQFDGAVHTDWWGTTGVALQAAIDYAEDNATKEVIIDQDITTAQDILIAGDKEIKLIGNGLTQIFTSFPGYTLIVGNETTTTTAQVDIENLIIRDGGGYANKLEVVNHRRFNATNCQFNEGLNGVVVYSIGDNNFTYDIKFDRCEFDSNVENGVHVYSGAGANTFTNLVSFSNIYASDNGTAMKLEKKSGSNEVTAINVSNFYFDNATEENNLLEMIGVYSCNLVNGSFDGLADEVQVVLDGDSYDNNISNYSIDGLVTDSGSRNSLNNSKGITFLTANRNLSRTDLRGSVQATSTATLTIPLNFTNMTRGQEISIESLGAVATITGASGVTVNGVNGGSVTVGNGTDYVKKTLRKGGGSGNIYYVFDGKEPSSTPAPKLFNATTTGAQSIDQNVFTKVDFTVETDDTEGWFASSTFTPLEAGYYLVGGTLSISNLADGDKLIGALYKNGTLYRMLGRLSAGALGFSAVSGSVIVEMNGTTDYVELYIFQSKSGGANIASTDGYNSFWGHKL